MMQKKPGTFRLDRGDCHLNGAQTWECLTLRCMEKMVRCSVKSLEQCIQLCNLI